MCSWILGEEKGGDRSEQRPASQCPPPCLSLPGCPITGGWDESRPWHLVPEEPSLLLGKATFTRQAPDGQLPPPG